MENTVQSRQAIGTKPTREFVERVYPGQILGSPEIFTVPNSFAPFSGFSSSSYEERRTLHAHSDLRADNVVLRVSDLFDHFELGYEQELFHPELPFSSTDAKWPELRLNDVVTVDLHLPQISGEDVIAAMQEKQPTILSRQQGRTGYAELLTDGTLASTNRLQISRVNFATGVETWAASASLAPEMRLVAHLCLEIVPDAQRVLVKLNHDPEDGSDGLTFCVSTGASVESVVAAEDTLHEALFQRLSAPKVARFSIIYEFVQ